MLPPNGVKMLALDQEFGADWHKFLHPAPGGDQILSFRLDLAHLPFYARNRTSLNVTRVDLIVDGATAADYVARLTTPGEAETGDLALQPDSTYGGRQTLAKSDFGQTAALLGDWSLKIRRSGAGDFKSLPPEELGRAYLVVGFKIA